MTEDDGSTRILNMRINNKEFLKGTDDSLKAINTLNGGIDKATKGKGMQSMGTQVDTVKTKFGAMQVAGVTALATITNKAVNAGLMMAKGLAIDPIMDGFREYEKLLTSTQTIAANTNNRSAAGIAKVGVKLDELNRYSDKTIYNFGQMAENAGRFTAAGVGLNDAVSSIKGLANAAALAGASNEQLGSAMYQTSQALGTGVVKLMDWRSLENANLGTKNMRAALLDTAHAMGEQGVAADAAIAKYGSFRDSLREGWLTADVFNKTMKVFAGTQRDGGKFVAYTVKQLREMGYSKEAAIRLNELSAASIDSATKIKTFSQLIDVTKEALGSGWAKLFRDLFGDLNEAGKIWTSVGGVITDVVDAIFGGVDRMLVKWKEMGGFKELWAGLGNVIQAVGNILRPFLMLFDAITPGSGSAGTALYGVTHAFYLFSVMLEKVTSVTNFAIPAFKAIGTAVDYVWKKIKVLIDWFKQFDYALAPLGPAMDRFGTAIKDAFETLFSGDFSGFGEKISAAFAGIWKEGVFVGTNLVEGIKAGLGVGSIEAAIKQMVDRFVNFFKNLLGIHSPSTVFQGYGQDITQGLANGITSGSGEVGTSIGGLFSSIWEKLQNIDKFDIANVFSAVFSAAVLTAMIKLIYSFTKAISSIANIGSNFSNMLEEVGNTLESMQTALKAQALKDIAIAIGILAVSLWLLSRLDYEELGKGLAAVSGLLVGLTLVMKSMAKNEQDTAKGIASVVAMSAAMVLLGTAVLILSAAVFAFGNMPTDVLVKGMASIAVVLAILAGASFLLGKAAPTMILAAGGVLILSLALAALAPVILLFSKLDWSTLMSGMLKMGIALLLLGVAMVPLAAQAPMILVASAALVVLSVALGMLLGTLVMYSKISWKTMMDGLKKIVTALVLLGVAAIVAAPGLILLGAAFALIGAGLLAAGIGMTLLGAGIAVVAAAGTAAGAVFITFIESFLALLPLMGIQFIAALDLILKSLAEKAPSMIDSIIIIIEELLRGISELAPTIVQTGIDILQALLDGLVQNQQNLWDTGIDLIIGFLEHVATRMDDIREAGVEAITQFIEGLGEDAGQLASTALQAIEDFLTALSQAIKDNQNDIQDLGAQIAAQILVGFNPINLAGKLVKALRDEISNEVGGGDDDGKSPTNRDGGKDTPGTNAHARGTDYAPGGLSLVGELGPELLSIRKGSAVITNKNLIGFMRSVSKLTRALANGGASSEISPGGTITLGVSADFKGDPRRDGAAFAANIAAGLMGGLQSQQSGVNQSMATMGSSMSQAFADILGIKSPSTVFKQFAGDVAKGFINGLIANIASVKKAATAMGQAVIQGVAKTITDKQLTLEAVRARSGAYDAVIELLRKKADKEDDPKKKEKLEKEIEDLEKKADQAKRTAEAQEKLVDEQNAAAERLLEFRAADTQQKAEMRKEDAAMAAAKASENRESALRLKMEADLVRQYDSKRADILEEKSKTVLKRATFYSDLANKYSKEAYEYARKVQQEIDAEMAKQLQTVSEIQVQNAQAAFDAYLKAVAEAESAAGEDRPSQDISFTQNNISPENISPAEAYRNGRSLVGIMERRLADS